MNMKKTMVFAAAILATVACTAAPGALDFSDASYREVSLSYNGTPVSFRYYQNIYYVTNVVDSTYQKMNLYIRAEYYTGGSVNGYTAETAPIFLYHKVAGYTAAKATTLASAVAKRGPRPGGRPQGGPGMGPGGPQGGPQGGPMGGGPAEPEDESLIPSEITDSPEHPFMPLAALLRGYVVAAPAVRGRTCPSGQAPSAIVDLKAAVRYLKFNDAKMPGDASKIISDGTSAGGALSALLGATGNHPDYEPYLKELGAAPATDDIFAAQAYCPITNLEHADAAYEWMFGSLDESQHGAITPEMKAVSKELAAAFPAYVNSLGYVNARGQKVDLEEDGTGAFTGWLCHFLRESAQERIDAGEDLSAYPWVEVKDGKVGEIDFDGYVRYVGRKKTPVAFDALDNTTGENNEFGTPEVPYRHFTAFSMDRNAVEGAQMAPEALVHLMNPMYYIPDQAALTAPHWRICHGTKDSDTAMAIPLLLATNLLNHGFDVIFLATWDQPHGGDYDTEAQFDWIDTISRQ